MRDRDLEILDQTVNRQTDRILDGIKTSTAELVKIRLLISALSWCHLVILTVLILALVILSGRAAHGASPPDFVYLNGTSATSPNPQIAWTTPGPKTMTLQVCNRSGCNTATRTVTVANPQPLSYVSIPPTRCLDTRMAGSMQNPPRATGPLAANSTLTVSLLGCGVPASAAAVVCTVGVILPPAAGWVTVWGSGGPPANTSAGNFPAGGVTSLAVIPQTVPNAAGTAAQFNLSLGGSKADLILDVTGYFVPVTPPLQSTAMVAVNRWVESAGTLALEDR